MPDLFLTFDVEDFINANSVTTLNRILEKLKRDELTGLFFITGNMAEHISNFPETIELLNEHQIGYHSSSHSTHPAIFEFTDTSSFNEAYKTSLSREIAHIDPLTGEIQGIGGIYALKNLFPKKDIVAFRAPGYCWSPPHTLALKHLGITFDFSAMLRREPVRFREITFYPFPICPSNWQGGVIGYLGLSKYLLKNHTTVVTFHPSAMVNQSDWDSIYYPNSHSKNNPIELRKSKAKTHEEIESNFRRFSYLLKYLKDLKKSHFLNITPKLDKADNNLSATLSDTIKYYKRSIAWAEGFGYKPKFLFNHYVQFLEIKLATTEIPNV